VAVAAVDGGAMSCTVGCQFADLLFMAGATLLCRGLSGPLVIGRSMRLMAAEAILIRHLRAVFVMTIDTGGELPLAGAVLVVTFVALLLGMQAGNLLHGGADFLMAAQAGFSGIIKGT